MKRASIFIGIVMAMILAVAGPGQAASPSSLSIGPSDSSDSWAGVTFTLGTTPGPAACGTSNLLCDHVSISVSVPSGYWSTHTGYMAVAISWSASSDNFDLYVGSAGSARGTSTSESVTIANPAGSYSVKVVPRHVTASAYVGVASFSSKPKPVPPAPSPQPPPTGGGGGGGGGGDGGGDGGGGGGGTGTSSGNGTGTNGGFSYPSLGGYRGGGSVYPLGPSIDFRGPSGGGLYTDSQSYLSGGNTFGGGTSQNSSTTKFQNGQSGRALPVSNAVPTPPRWAWALIPLGLLTFAAVAWVIFEPEEFDPTSTGPGTISTIRRNRAELTVLSIGQVVFAMFGGMAAGGRALGRSAARAVGRVRGRKDG
jgi:hypothetical protein